MQPALGVLGAAILDVGQRGAQRQKAAAAEKAAADADLFAMRKSDGFTGARRYNSGIQIEERSATPARRGDSMAEAFGKSMARQIGSKAGQVIVRGVLGSLFRGK